MSKAMKNTILVMEIILVVALLVVLGLFIKKETNRKNDEKAANKVIALIDQLDDAPITLESEQLLTLAKAEYDMLTVEQKELVSNYSMLEQGFEALQKQKDREVAEEFSKEIAKINENNLEAGDVMVANLMAEYKELTKSQQSFVKNYDLLIRYQNVVQRKNQEKKQKDLGMKLAENFRGYEGAWGDFGGHVNSYQGMIEDAIKRDIDYKGVFEGDVNSLQFSIGYFEKSSTRFGMGVAYFYFSGWEKDYNYYLTMGGEVIIKADGTLSCKVTDYY